VNVESGCLSDFPRSFGLGPLRRHELLDLSNLRPRQLPEQIFQTIEWVEAAPTATASEV
jgi:hypothetical protein